MFFTCILGFCRWLFLVQLSASRGSNLLISYSCLNILYLCARLLLIHPQNLIRLKLLSKILKTVFFVCSVSWMFTPSIKVNADTTCPTNFLEETRQLIMIKYENSTELLIQKLYYRLSWFLRHVDFQTCNYFLTMRSDRLQNTEAQKAKKRYTWRRVMRKWSTVY